MFWKKKSATEEQLKPKAKKLSPRKIIEERIKQLAPGQSISYRLLETFGGGLAVVELNPQYPTEGRMYILSTEKIVDGKPTGKRNRLWDSDKPRDIAGWILDRNGELFS